MELGGDEKRIQALFSELSLADQAHTPEFGRLWIGATREFAMRQAVAPLREKTSLRPIAIFVSLLITAAVCSLAVWAWSNSSNSTSASNIPPQPATEINYTSVSVAPQPKSADKPRRKHVRRQLERRTKSDVALLSSWQSPTQALLESPTSLVLNAIPELDQSVKDLKSFLPKNNELIKESNQ
ncbi:MAG TPA: hypothetical protein VFI24_21255 [Pyrinomonadaceae bacterium]|nr:hypothetical protein [Pyrinomonadaceae bacterium]